MGSRFALVPMRLFLGATFVYAGLQKLTDSGFFAGGGRTYIGRQLQGFAPRSPLGGTLTWLGQNAAVEVGVVVIATELLVGAATLAGYRTRLAASVGAGLSFILFLSASWDVQPYFLGSDSIYTVAWTTLALSGDEGVRVPVRRLFGVSKRPGPRFDAGRRALLLQLGGGAVALVWVLGLLPRGRAGASAVTTQASSSPSATPSQPTATASSSPAAGPATPVATPPSGTAIGTLQQLASQGSIAYQDPKSGDPAVAVSLGGNKVAAYDAVCTHAGCTVEYDASQQVLICPCHGAAFDPAHKAAVLQGPAATALPGLNVHVGPDGTIYAEG